MLIKRLHRSTNQTCKTCAGRKVFGEEMSSTHIVVLLLGLISPSFSIPQYGGGDVDQQKTGDVKDGGNSQCGHISYDCVPYFQCLDGVINTDGTGLLDLRIDTQGTCVNPDYPDVPAVCCLIPGHEPTPTPVQTCPKYQECVDYNLCDANGLIVTDGSGQIDIRTGYISCWLPTGIGGRCCTPPAPHVDTCPSTSVCVPESDCLGTALDAANNFIDFVSTGLWTKCSHVSGDGVCCIPPLIDTCPGDSVCVTYEDCLGTALDATGKFVDFVKTGSWSHCTDYQNGVCCINPLKPVLPTATHCGVRNYKLDQRIASPHANNEAAFGEFPWQGIIFYQNYTFICGASVISNNYLLTAAHCIDGLHAADLRIRLGEWQVNSFDEPLPYVDKNIHGIYLHPDFNPKNVHNDIAILELKEPLEFQYHINSVCLSPNDYVVEPYTVCYASGWGKESFTGNFQHILKKIDLPYIEFGKCQDLLRKTRLGRYFRLDKSFVCAGGEENKDACYGDGGGPLICKDPKTARYSLIGITSWGIGCGTKNVPGVYANVPYFFDWINGIVGSGGGGNGQQEQQYGK